MGNNSAAVASVADFVDMHQLEVWVSDASVALVSDRGSVAVAALVVSGADACDNLMESGTVFPVRKLAFNYPALSCR